MNQIPVITVFVRHSAGCPEFSDPFFKRCNCKKHLRWFHAGKQHTRSAGSRTWAGAEDARRKLEKSFDKSEEATPAPTPETTRQKIATYIQGKESEELSISTIRKLKHQLGMFDAFMAERGKFTPAEIEVRDVIEFRAGWSANWDDLTRIKAQSNLRGFLRSCCKENLPALLQALRKIKETNDGRERRKPKPLTDEERKALLAQVPSSFATWPEKAPRIKAFIKCASSVGLACADMVNLERKAVEKAAKTGVLEISRVKTKRPATPRIDPKLCDELLKVANGNPRYIFWNGTALPTSSTGLWLRDLQRVFEAAKLWIPGNLSHRFRDTAVDRWIGEGYDMTEIAAMLGDTVQITEKHYASLKSDRMLERLAKRPALSGD